MDKYLWQFLSAEQRKTAQQQIKAICLQLKLPKQSAVIRQYVCSIRISPAVFKIDPKRQIYLSKIFEENEAAVVKSLLKLFQSLLEMIQKSIDIYKNEENLRYLGKSYFQIARQEFNLNNLQWKFTVERQLLLSNKFQKEVKQLFGYTIQRVAQVFQLHHSKNQQLVQFGIDRFKQKVEKLKRHLQKQQKQRQGVYKSLILLKQHQKSEIADLIDQFQQYEEKLEEQQEVESINNLEKNTQDIYQFRVSNNKLFPQKMRQTTLKDQNNEQKDCKNIEYLITISQAEKQFMQQVSFQDEVSLQRLVNEKFNRQQKQRVIFALNKPLLQWESEGPLCFGESDLVQINRLKLYSLKNSLQKAVKQIQCGQSEGRQKYFILVGLLYKTVEKQYSPLSKKYLMKIMESIEGSFTTRDYPYLRGALRIIQKSSIKPSKMAQKLWLSAPYRSKHLLKHIEEPINIQGQLSQLNLASNEIIKLQRLTHENQTKNVTFLVSGFLSQDSEKDIEWLPVIRALEQTELYGVLWRSSSKFELITYLASMTANVALNVINKTKVGVLFTLAKLGTNLLSKVTGKETLKQENPFYGALNRAKQAGKELAKYLIEHFADRHITLIGFSMGTEVIRSCVEYLIEKKKQDLLFKIVTIGGVAERDKVQNLLRTANSPLSWLNFRSKKDYAVRFLFRACTLGAKPIGSATIKQIHGHQIMSWEMGKVVSSHMDFRPNLYGLCLMAGIRHD